MAKKTLDPTGTYFQPETTGIPAFESGEQEQGIRPTKWGAFIESIKLGSMDSPVGAIPGYEGAGIRALVQSQMETEASGSGQAKLSPEEANKRYPGLSKPFSEPIYPAVADLIASDVRRKENMRAWVDRGPGLGTASSLLASGVAEGLDPFNLAASLATGGVASALRIGGRGAIGAARVFGENVVGNLAGSAVTASQRSREGEDVTLAGELTSATVGAVVGTGIHYGIAGLVRGTGMVLGRAENLAARMSPDAQERSLRAAIHQHENGAKVDVSPSVKEAELRMSGAVQPGADPGPYRFEGDAPAGGRTFYMAADANTGAPVSFADVGQVGLSVVDNPQVASNLASAPDSPFTGRLREVTVPADAKLLNLETSLADPQAKAFVDAIEARMGAKFDLPEGATLKDVLSEIRTGFVDGPEGRRPAIREAADIAQAQGFEGYQYVDETTSQKHHGVVLFDETRGEVGQEFMANNDLTPRMTGEEAAQMSAISDAPDSARTYEPDLDGKIEQLRAQPPANLEPDYMDAVLQEQELSAKTLLKVFAEEDPKLEVEIQGLAREKARHAQEIQAFKDYTACLIEGTV